MKIIFKILYSVSFFALFFGAFIIAVPKSHAADTTSGLIANWKLDDI